MSSVDKIKWAMSLRDPQYEALKCFDNISSKIEYKTASKSEAEKVASENCQELHKIVVDKEFDFPSFCFDMTTGIGKTRLMGACIYYLYKTKGYKHFFILCPGNTIYDKMRRETVPGNPKYMFKGLEAEMGRPKVYDGENYLSYPVRYVQSELQIEKTSEIQLFIFNISKIFTRGDLEFKFHKFNENLGGSFADVLRSFDDLVFCMDEAHRYYAPASKTAINYLNPVLGLEFTATPKSTNKNIIFHYGLEEGAGKFLKIPVVMGRTNTAGYSDDDIEEMKLKDGIKLHERRKAIVYKYCIDNGLEQIKPIVLVACKDTTHAKKIKEKIYSVLLQEAFILSEDPKYQNYVDPYYTLVGYFNSIRELGGAVRLLDDDINSRLKVLRKKYKNARQRYLGFDGKKEITSRIPSYQIAEILEKLAEPFDPSKERQSCYDVVIATNMIAVGMDVDRLGLMAVVGQPKQNSEYIQATSRVGRKYPGIIFTVYNPYRPRDLSNYENFVGFHSQMYRYVEGTTATPFAARARDRALHALVVAMLRLQTETMAGNKGASNILSISDEELGKIKDQILERISIVAPMAYESASDDIDAFISTWKEIAKDENLYYFVTNTENNKRLLSYYGQPITGKEKPTLNSMRDVEQSSTVYLYEEGGAL